MFGCCCGEVVLIKVLGKGEMIYDAVLHRGTYPLVAGY